MIIYTTNTRKIFIYFDNNKKDNLFLIVEKEKVKNLYYPRYNYISNLNKFKYAEIK